MRWIELTGPVVFAAAATAAMAADAFQDVPRGHWAYQALQQLQQEQMVKGWRGRFHGGRSFTRYEMAVVLARYLEQMRNARDAIKVSVEKTYPLLERLSKEFARELDLLGVRTRTLDGRVAKLEKGVADLRTLVGENRRLIDSVVRRLDGLKRGDDAGTPVARLPASLGGAPIRSAIDVDRILAETIQAVREGRISRTQAYSIGYLANILYRRVRDAQRAGLVKGMDDRRYRSKLARLEETLTVRRGSGAGRGRDAGVGQAE